MMNMFVYWLIVTFDITPDDLVFEIYIHKNSEHRIVKRSNLFGKKQ